MRLCCHSIIGQQRLRHARNALTLALHTKQKSSLFLTSNWHSTPMLGELEICPMRGCLIVLYADRSLPKLWTQVPPPVGLPHFSYLYVFHATYR